MKKIFIGSTKLAKGMEEIKYHSATKKIKETEPFYYGFSTVIANTVEKDDNVKLIILELQRKSGAIKDNTVCYQKDLEKIKSNCAATIEEPKIIPLPFNESKSTFESAFSELIEELEDEAEIYVDITFGAKTTSLLLLSFLQFAEKFFNCSVKMIVYVQRDFDENEKPIIGSESIYDVTSLFYLNSLMNSMNCKAGTEAVETVKSFFAN